LNPLLEREAIRAVTEGIADTITKSVKFAERPSLEQLTRQLELLCNCFEYITSNPEDLDLCMSLSPDDQAVTTSPTTSTRKSSRTRTSYTPQPSPNDCDADNESEHSVEERERRRGLSTSDVLPKKIAHSDVPI
jgi:hypothetical protein